MSAPLWDQSYSYIKVRAFGLAVFVLSQPRIVQLLCDYSVSAFADQSGFCLESLGRVQDAAFSLAKRARAAGRGRALLSKDAYGEAVPDFTHAIARNPKDALARNGRAWALFKLGNLPAALEDADQPIAADPTYAAASRDWTLLATGGQRKEPSQGISGQLIPL